MMMLMTLRVVFFVLALALAMGSSLSKRERHAAASAVDISAVSLDVLEFHDVVLSWDFPILNHSEIRLKHPLVIFIPEVRSKLPPGDLVVISSKDGAVHDENGVRIPFHLDADDETKSDHVFHHSNVHFGLSNGTEVRPGEFHKLNTFMPNVLDGHEGHDFNDILLPDSGFGFFLSGSEKLVGCMHYITGGEYAQTPHTWTASATWRVAVVPPKLKASLTPLFLHSRELALTVDMLKKTLNLCPTKHANETAITNLSPISKQFDVYVEGFYIHSHP